jgi:hypothetical protein
MVASQMQENHFECGNLITISIFAKEYMPYLLTKTYAYFGMKRTKTETRKIKLADKKK